MKMSFTSASNFPFVVNRVFSHWFQKLNLNDHLFYFGQVVMTIIVAFILEAFLFRIEYRKEHPTDEKGKTT